MEELVAEAYRKHGYLLGFFDDVVEAIMYLDQATFVTGEILHVDGGQAISVGSLVRRGCR